jgi:tetratricopeptide (TPR) repeat protein/DNA-binding Xre family transcriptional regulator
MPEQLGGRSDLAAALTVLRVLRGVEQEDLAKTSGISYAKLLKIEQGRRRPRTSDLQALLPALGADPALLEEMLDMVRRVRRGPSGGEAEGSTGAAVVRGLGGVPISDLKAHLRGTFDATGARVSPVPVAESRRRAPALWARLAGYSHAARCALVQESGEFQDVGLCELLCDLSVEAAADKVQRARLLAELAVLASVQLQSDSGFRRRVEGFCRMHLANAYRVGGSLPEASEEFARGAELWHSGATADPGLLNETRPLQIEAALRRDQGNVSACLTLLDRALAIDRWGKASALLIAKSTALEGLGDSAGAIAVLRQAAPLLDGERDVRELFAVRVNLAFHLCRLGKHRTAEQALSEIRRLSLRLGNCLDELRVGWLEARVAAGLGRTDEAIAGLERVRAGFERQQIPYDVALVTVEIAELHASQGRTAEVKALVREAAPVFEAQGVHREAQRALALFRRAVEEERVTIDLVRGILAYLERARRNPQLRYEEAG